MLPAGLGLAAAMTLAGCGFAQAVLRFIREVTRG
jgi:hypothetical protein